MSGIDDFLSRLNRVKKTHSGWIASCPTGNHEHGDRHPSLTVAVGTDGRVLVKCHAYGCGIDEIAEAVGMSVSDLMPENLGFHRLKPQRIPFNALDVMSAMRTDLTVALVLCKDMQGGKPLDASDSLLLAKLIGRVTMGIELAGGV